VFNSTSTQIADLRQAAWGGKPAPEDEDGKTRNTVYTQKENELAQK